MSTLLIDVGNTRVKWSWFDHSESAAGQPKAKASGAVTHREASLSTVQSTLQGAWEALPVSESAIAVWVASVGNQVLTEVIDRICGQLWSTESQLITSAPRWGELTNGYELPEQLGVDRWMAVIAAYHRYRDNNVLIVDAGTSVTIDAIMAGGQHIGGAIFPGYLLQQQSLQQDTANLATLSETEIPDTDVDTEYCPTCASPDMPFATNTKAAIEAGIDGAVVGAIEYFIRRMEAVLASRRNFSIKILITGGDAKRIMAKSSEAFEHTPELVIEGMLLIAQPTPYVSDNN